MVSRRHRAKDVAGYGALAGAAVACQLLWVSVVDSFGRSTFTTPGGGAPTAAEGPVGRVLDEPTTYLSYLWYVFLPRLPFMNDLLVQPWPADDIYEQVAGVEDDVVADRLQPLAMSQWTSGGPCRGPRSPCRAAARRGRSRPGP
jgi:hypothetical protein